MARPVRSDSVHQSFNNAFSTDTPLPNSNESYAAIQHTPFVNVKANSNVFKVDVAGIVDSGSTVTLIPQHLLNEEELKNLDPTDVKITGVTPGLSPIIGKATVDIILGDSSIYKDLEVFITKRSHPLLIGTNVLKHTTVTRFDMDFSNRKMLIHRQHSHGTTVEEVELLKDEEAFKSIHKTHHAGQTLQSKMEWLKSKGIKLPTSHK